MLRVRREASAAFAAAAWTAFEERLTLHLLRHFPAECARAGEPRVLEIIRGGAARAAGYGLHAERTLCAFVDAMFLLGLEFDRDPAIPWAPERLRAIACAPPEVQADLLLDEVFAHLRAARSEDREDEDGG